jgi:hypothetical protein
MSLGKQNTTNGTSQLQRLHPALAPASVLFSGLSIRDLLTYAHRLAREIHFYDVQNLPVGNWQQFLDYFVEDDVSGAMKPEAEIQSIISRKKDFDPHLGLFLVFLHLFEHLQADMNAITQRHLDFYFEETLGIRRKAAQADQVHVIFELAKNASQELIKAGTVLDAGKAANGQPLRYQLDRDVVVNSARLSFIKSVFVDTIRNSCWFYAAPVANSADGLGMPFATDIPAWSAFGESQRDKPRNQRTMVDAELGFAFASPQLLLREGRREITLRIHVEAPTGYFPERQIGNAFDVALSGEKGWIQPSRVVSRIEGAGTAFRLLVQLTLNTDLPAVVGYRDEVLGAGFATTQPVVRLMLRPQARAYETLSPLQLTAIDIEVDVRGMSNLVLANDQGPIDPGKPFLPFGTQPNIGSSFYIGSEEVFSKRLDELELKIQWHNLPDFNNLGRYYQSYIGNAASLNNGSFEASAQFAYRGKNYQVNQRERLFNSNNPSNEHTITISSNQILSALSSSGIDYIRQPEPQSFLGDTKIKHFSLSLSAPNRNNLQAFGHPNYTMLMTAAVLAQATQSNPLPPPPLPNSPYTPEIKTLGLSYRSRHLTSINSSSQYDTVYQIGPFGWKHVGAEDSDRFLLPQIHSEGTMFLGLTEFRPPSTINLLIQLAEGTAKAGFQLPSP